MQHCIIQILEAVARRCSEKGEEAGDLQLY